MDGYGYSYQKNENKIWVSSITNETPQFDFDPVSEAISYIKWGWTWYRVRQSILNELLYSAAQSDVVLRSVHHTNSLARTEAL